MKLDKRQYKYTTIFAAIFAFLYTFQRKINFRGNVGQKLYEDTFSRFEINDLLIFLLAIVFFFIILLLLYTLYYLFVHLFSDDNTYHVSKGRLLFHFVFVSNFIINTVYLLSSYPGSIIPDSLQSVRQAMGDILLSNHHPLLFTFMLSFFIKIGLFLWDDLEKGIFLFCIFQSLIYSYTISNSIKWLYKKTGIKYALLSASFYLLNPIFHTYALVVQKDALFAISLLWLTLSLNNYIENTTKNNLCNLALSLFLVAFLRNNGLFIDWFVCAFLFIRYRKKMSKLICISLISLMLLFSVIQGPIYRSLGLISGKVETYGIPLQQVAYVLSTNRNSVSADQKEILNNILPIERWISDYTPFIVDSIKFNSSFDHVFFTNNIGSFIGVWLKLLPKNFINYIKAYAMETYGFWSLGTQNSYGYADNYVQENEYGITQTDLIYERLGIDINIIKKIIFPDAGTLLWLLLLGLYIYLMRDGYCDSISIFVPSLLAWGTIMIATPVAFSLRYVFILALGVPFYYQHGFTSKNQSKAADY